MLQNISKAVKALTGYSGVDTTLRKEIIIRINIIEGFEFLFV